MPTKKLLVTLPLAALALVGCQSLFGSGNGGQVAEADMSKVDMTSYYAQRLAAGRLHLERGQLAAAATAFRQASYHPQYAAQAYNGMAVAYDRLGRGDLAERFFALAIKTDPSEAAYARNFALFRDAHPLSDEARQALAVTDTGLAEGQTTTAGITAEATDDRIERLSGREVRLHSTPEGGAAQIAKAGTRTTRPAEVNVQNRAQQMARSRQAEEASRHYPLRVEVAKEDSADRSLFSPPTRPARRIVRSAPSRSYPVRVEIPSS